MSSTSISAVGDGQEHEEIAEPQAASASLAGRMSRRQEELATRTSEWFPIPGYEDVLEVELKVLGYTTIRKINQRNERIRDDAMRELTSMADQLVKATAGFREVLGGEKRRPIDDNWISLASRLENAPDFDGSPRRALLHLVGEQRLHFLSGEWALWAKTVRPEVDEEVVEDFGTTG